MNNWLSTEALARRTARHPWRTLLLWGTLLAASLVAASGVGAVLHDDSSGPNSYESVRAHELVQQRMHGGESVPREYVVVEADAARFPSPASENPAFRLFVAELVADLRGVPTVSSAVSYLDGIPGGVAQGGDVVLLVVELERPADYVGSLARPVVDLIQTADATDGVRVTTAGNGSINLEFMALAKDTLIRGELLGVGVGLVILLAVFGIRVAAGLPILLAIAAIIPAIGAVAVVGQIVEMSTFVVNIIVMIGLAVGIDYSLFIVHRFREEREAGHELITAICTAASTASRAVFFSGIAVVIALGGLLMMPDSLFKSLGIGAILVVLVAVAAALTLLPAVLGLLGDRVNRPSVRLLHRRNAAGGRGAFWSLVTRTVTARPLVSALATTALLLGVASFVLGINLGENGVSSMPESSRVRHAVEVLNREFSSGLVHADIVVDAPDVHALPVQRGIEALVAALRVDPFFGDTTVVGNQSADLALVRAVMRGDAAGPEARDAVSRLREQYIPAAFAGSGATVLVGGDSAWLVDSVAATWRYMPLVFGFVLALSFLLLLLVFRSIVVPLKAVAMNLLSVGAAYGLIVLVFQHGVGASLFGFHRTPVVDSWIPLFLFSILFGLSMDYHVFLLSRVKERYDLTKDNLGSVAWGLRSTGAIITGAAAIMVAVFGGFAAGDLVMFQQVGFGLAVAVIIDATVIRCVLVPASMALLGDRNWYLPHWLEWLPRLDVEGGRRARPLAHAGFAPALVDSE